MTTTKPYAHASIKKLPDSQVEITASVPAEIFDGLRKKALKNINATIEIDGFRKGNAPEKILIAKVGEKTILEEMAELALGDAYPAIVIDNKLDPIGRPEISITKIAMGNPLEFTIKTAVTPEITLGDYKKIAKGIAMPKKEEPITDKDVAEAIDRIKESYKKRDQAHGHSHDEGHEHSHEHTHEHSEKAHPEIETPEFKERIREALTEDKRRIVREKHRLEIAEKIADASSVELPAILIESEIRRTEAQFTEDIARMGTKLEDYLTQAKKTIEEIRKEWKPHAEKKVKLQLILNKIADTEKIVADAKEIEAEVNHILEHYKDADRDRATVYAAGVLTNEKVFEFLEKQNTN